MLPCVHSNGDRCTNVRIRVIVLQSKIIVLEIKQLWTRGLIVMAGREAARQL
jgi:hypothetical protein